MGEYYHCDKSSVLNHAKKIGYDSLYLMIEKYKREIKELEELVYNEERDQGINF